MDGLPTCSQETEWGRCQQTRILKTGLCSYHTAALDPGFRHDPYYHRKIVLGLLEPTYDYISPVEADTLFRGRPRNDGRRLDAWTR